MHGMTDPSNNAQKAVTGRFAASGPTLNGRDSQAELAVQVQQEHLWR
jgi:hypothetical protein